jgi:hypothetical protein
MLHRMGDRRAVDLHTGRLGAPVAVPGDCRLTRDVNGGQDEEGQSSCKAALPGTFVDVEGAASATFCPLGRFQPNAGAIKCLVAAIGTYVDGLGAAVATTVALRNRLVGRNR